MRDKRRDMLVPSCRYDPCSVGRTSRRMQVIGVAGTNRDERSRSVTTDTVESASAWREGLQE
jgi:hypothetical protein